MNFHNLEAMTPQGKVISMSDFEGKVILVVNTATQCGLAPQFKGLEGLHQRYKDKGLVVLGFPCNQFRNQEPETNETMVQRCEEGFGVTFQLTEKINVNGKNTHPVFVYLKDQLAGKLGKKIKWNFTKFLISPDGHPLKRYAPTTKPEVMEKDIISLISKMAHPEVM